MEGLTRIVPTARSTRRCSTRGASGGVGPPSFDSPYNTIAPPLGLRPNVGAMEGLTRIELASSVWKTEALPLSYSPEFRRKYAENGWIQLLV